MRKAVEYSLNRATSEGEQTERNLPEIWLIASRIKIRLASDVDASQTMLGKEKA
jgi:hypothetical protein